MVARLFHITHVSSGTVSNSTGYTWHRHPFSDRVKTVRTINDDPRQLCQSCEFKLWIKRLVGCQPFR